MSTTSPRAGTDPDRPAGPITPPGSASVLGLFAVRAVVGFGHLVAGTRLAELLAGARRG